MASTVVLEGRLRVRPKPLPGESLRGFLLYLSERNGLSPRIDLYAQLRTWRGNVSEEKLEAIAGICGAEVESLPTTWHQASVWDWQSQFAYGLPVDRRWVRTQQCAVCPRCLAAGKRIPANWELAYSCACPEHGCWLIDVCPRCTAALRWRRNGVGECRCGFDLGRAITKPAAKAAVQLAAILRDCLRGHLPSRADAALAVPQGFLALSLSEMLTVIGFVARLRANVKARGEVVPAPGTSRLGLQSQDIQLAGRVLADWPAALHRTMLTSIRMKAGVEGGGIDLISFPEARQLAELTQHLASFPEVLAEEVQAFVDQRMIGFGNRRLFLLHDQLPPPRGPFDSRSRDTDRLSRACVAHAMRARVDDLDALADVGLLPKAGRSIRMRDVDRAVAMLRQPLKEFEELGYDKAAQVVSISAGDPKRLARLLFAVMTGRLKAYGFLDFSLVGLEGIWVDRDEARRFLKARTREVEGCC